jgi:hypothetical protein
MTVKRRTAKRSIRVPRGTTERIRYTPPKLPDKPPVDQGPKSYGLSQAKRHIVNRFYVSNYDNKVRHHKDRWWVHDCEEGGTAKGTQENGYSSQKEAIKIAEKYRDEFGAWSLLPF